MPAEASPALAAADQDEVASAASSPGVGADSGLDSGNDHSPPVPSVAHEATPKAGDDASALVQEVAFLSLRVVPPAGSGAEPFELQVAAAEMVHEIHQLLMERDDCCHRTCFSLALDGRPLDAFAELRHVEGLRSGAVLRVVEEPYTVREARIHLRHVRDLLRGADPADLYAAADGCSPSFVNLIAGGASSQDKRRQRLDAAHADCLPPEHCLPPPPNADGAPDAPPRDVPLSPLLPPAAAPADAPPCLKALAPSAWNPPPGNRKLQGDLLYVRVLTAEDKPLHVTCCARGFYVNQSSDEQFNPAAAEPRLVCHSLVELLAQLSATFRRNFPLAQRRRCQRHPFERVATPFQLFSWLAPPLDHAPDAIRAEDAFAGKLGYEEHIPGQTREWNEELQATRELPRASLAERLLRERATFKVHGDFVAAATRGAAAVVDGQVLAINPGDDARMHMFIWHNVFFSLGYDVKDHYRDWGGDAAAFAAPLHDLAGVRAHLQLDTPGLHVLGTAVVDYRGQRVTAQSIIPGILERDQEQSVVHGSTDFGRSVRAAPRYAELLRRPAQQLRLLPHSVRSADGQVVTLQTSVESKGIVGNDGRHYLLDLLRTFPPDVHFLADAEVGDAARQLGFPRAHPHAFCCLRPELLDAFVESRYVAFVRAATGGMRQRLQDADTEKSSGTDADAVRRAAELVGSLSDTEFDIRFNPDCFSPTVTAADDEAAVTKQKRLVRDAAEFLLTTQLPGLVADCADPAFLPIDGAALCEALHARGVNIRYLGTLADMIGDSPPILHYLKSLCCAELVCRGAKRLFRRFQAALDRRASAAAATAHFLNCLFAPHCPPPPTPPGDAADSLAPSRPPRGRRRHRNAAAAAQGADKPPAPDAPQPQPLDWAAMSSRSLWAALQAELAAYFGFRLDSESLEALAEQQAVPRVALLRRFCTASGVQLLCRDYFQGARSGPQLFSEEDVLAAFPVVKHAQPKAMEAQALLGAAQARVQAGQLRLGSELLGEALAALTGVYGALHAELAPALRLAARLAYVLGDAQDALQHQHRAALVSERCLGLDHARTVLEYTHLALYCFAQLQVGAALRLLYRARYLLALCGAERHPHMALVDSNIGLILHAVGELDASRRFLERALALQLRLGGERGLRVAQAHQLLARTQASRGDFRAALAHEQRAFHAFKHQLGETHERTAESGARLRQLTAQAVSFQKRMNLVRRQQGSVAQMLPQQHGQQPAFGAVLELLNLVNGIVFVQLGARDVEALRQQLDRRTAEMLSLD